MDLNDSNEFEDRLLDKLLWDKAQAIHRISFMASF